MAYKNDRRNSDNGEIKEIERQLNSYDMLKDIDMKKLIDEKDGFAYIIADNSKNCKETFYGSKLMFIQQ